MTIIIETSYKDAGVPWWLSGLRICPRHCSTSGWGCSMDSISGPGTSHAKKKKKSLQRRYVHMYALCAYVRAMCICTRCGRLFECVCVFPFLDNGNNVTQKMRNSR